MKIVHICLIGPFTDDWNYQENLLTKYHRKSNYDVSVITSHWVWGANGVLTWDARDFYVDDQGCVIYRLNIKRGDLSNRLKKYYGLYELLIKEQPNILFIHGSQFLDIFTVVKYLKRHKQCRVFVDNHSDFTNSATNWFSRYILHGVLWRMVAHLIEPYTIKFYGVLPARVDFLKNIYKLPSEKCALLVMGGDDELIQVFEAPNIVDETRKRYGISDEDFLIVTGGKVDSFKAQTLLLMEAVKNIPEKHVRLIIFGSVDKGLKNAFNQFVDGLHIQYIGWLNSENIYKLFAASDLVFFPGRHSVLWEQAVAQGIPMICRRWEGTTHVDLGGNVIFYEKDDTEEIRSLIEAVIYDKPLYNKMQAIARTKGREKFSYKRIAERCLKCD